METGLDIKTKHFCTKYDLALLEVIKHDLLHNGVESALTFINHVQKSLKIELIKLDYKEE